MFIVNLIKKAIEFFKGLFGNKKLLIIFPSFNRGAFLFHIQITLLKFYINFKLDLTILGKEKLSQ
ncbi:epsilon family phenol-soluble modulin [Staphylococcus capitis]|nr:epsilon family phenol-soluble modulin [Staphylococcus capitis]